jgi:hypothetical protein
MHEKRMQSLGMLGALPPALPDDGAHDERNVQRTAIHVVGFGGHIDQLIHGQEEKIHPNMDMNRFQAGERCPDGDSGHGILGKRGVKYTINAELFLEPQGCPVDALKIVYPQPIQYD